ncbi:helix-turn-helix domain-containing protein [Streptomyces sp. O3]
MTDRAEEVQRVLDAIDAVAVNEPPAVRAQQLTKLMSEARTRMRARRRAAVLEMHQSGMTYRQIGAELDISFGRVRQILAEEVSTGT